MISYSRQTTFNHFILHSKKNTNNSEYYIVFRPISFALSCLNRIQNTIIRFLFHGIFHTTLFIYSISEIYCASSYKYIYRKHTQFESVDSVYQKSIEKVKMPTTVVVSHIIPFHAVYHINSKHRFRKAFMNVFLSWEHINTVLSIETTWFIHIVTL